jgi:hypothetical protein
LKKRGGRETMPNASQLGLFEKLLPAAQFLSVVIRN